jgi:NADH-quinone oxidoreductase subunit C
MLPELLQTHEEATGLEAALPGAITAGKYDRGELTLEIAPDQIVGACLWFKREAGYERLSTVTGVDRYPAEPRFEVVYHLHSVSKKKRVRLKSLVSGKDPVIDSVTPVWRSANWYEREIFDLFGITFRNHPDLKRIMLPEDWEGHPLRKDYPVTGNRV